MDVAQSDLPMQAIDRFITYAVDFLEVVSVVLFILAGVALLVALWRCACSVLAFVLTDVPSIQVDLDPGARYSRACTYLRLRAAARRRHAKRVQLACDCCSCRASGKLACHTPRLQSTAR